MKITDIKICVKNVNCAQISKLVIGEGYFSIGEILKNVRLLNQDYVIGEDKQGAKIKITNDGVFVSLDFEFHGKEIKENGNN